MVERPQPREARGAGRGGTGATPATREQQQGQERPQPGEEQQEGQERPQPQQLLLLQLVGQWEPSWSVLLNTSQKQTGWVTMEPNEHSAWKLDR